METEFVTDDLLSRPVNTKRLRVLLLSPNVFGTTGGGQSFYRRLINNYPQIDFYCLDFPYFEKSNCLLPKNVTMIRIQRYHSADHRGFDDLKIIALRDALAETIEIGRSLKGLSFDIVDYPDYGVTGIFARSVFKYFGIECQRFVLSMHGLMSESLMRSWYKEYRDESYLSVKRWIETIQMEVSDISYSISPAYINERTYSVASEIKLLDPEQILNPVRLLSSTKDIDISKIKLVFIGRLEKRKGVDVAIDLISLLPEHLRRPLHIIGANEIKLGLSAKKTLKTYADFRGVETRFYGQFTKEELESFLKDPCIAILPSRYDTFNLAAWEALAWGTPVFVGQNAGITSFLKDRFPRLPVENINTDSIFDASRSLIDWLENYNTKKKTLHDALKDIQLEFANDLPTIYMSPPCANKNTIHEIDSKFEEIKDSFNFGQIPISKKIKFYVSDRLGDSRFKLVLRELRRAVLNPIDAFQTVKAFILLAAKRSRIRNFLIIIYSFLPRYVCKILFDDRKSFRLFRSPQFYELAYSAAADGCYAAAAAYGIRVLRWSNGQMNIKDDVHNWLTKAGYEQEAFILNLMFYEKDRIYNYLESRTAITPNLTAGFEKIYDNRQNLSNPKVSVVVSAYDVANKIDTFLLSLSDQSLVHKGQVELVIIDSGSPRGEHHFKTIQTACESTRIPFVLARTLQRETIQAAWNKGLSLAHSNYVALLGVDEALTADALEQLSNYLDSHPNIDWVMGDSIVTEVAPDGEWMCDVMKYDRRQLTRADHILECCYFSYVGGLYRKNIHERCGWYDESFGAAGDTEFKNRILPFAQVAHIPKVFGIFKNYPEERVTESPRAEIEDLRAWYLFRSAEGLKYITKNFSDSEIIDLLSKCFGYRKSYCSHTSFDVEVGANLLEIVKKRGLHDRIVQLAKDASILNEALTKLESSRTFWAKFKNYLSFRILLRFRKMQKFSIFQENRFEQHSHLWPTVTNKIKIKK